MGIKWNGGRWSAVANLKGNSWTKKVLHYGGSVFTVLNIWFGLITVYVTSHCVATMINFQLITLVTDKFLWKYLHLMFLSFLHQGILEIFMTFHSVKSHNLCHFLVTVCEMARTKKAALNHYRLNHTNFHSNPNKKFWEAACWLRSEQKWYDL